MVCGGIAHTSSSSSCWHLTPNGTWEAGPDLVEKMQYFSMTAVGDRIIVIGGASTRNKGLNGVLKYHTGKKHGWERMKNAPRLMIRHCAVLINATYVMVIGGQQNNQVIYHSINIVAEIYSHNIFDYKYILKVCVITVFCTSRSIPRAHGSTTLNWIIGHQDQI